MELITEKPLVNLLQNIQIGGHRHRLKKKQHRYLLQHLPELPWGKAKVKERAAKDAHRKSRRCRCWEELASQLRLQMLLEAQGYHLRQHRSSGCRGC